MTSMQHSESQPVVGHVLVVDDDPRNRELLRDLLVTQGHRVAEAEDGAYAIEKATSVECDAILMDVMMPRLDGIEACRRLKQAPQTAHIPVLMVTALPEKEQRLRGIAAGANDYLTKPIDRQDVILRVRNAVHAKHLYDRVEAELARARELESLRENLTRFIVHDMRAPLMAIMGSLQLVADRAQVSEENKQFLNMALDATSELTEMVTSMLDVSRLESNQMPLRRTMSKILVLAKTAARKLAPLASSHDIRISVSGDPAPSSVDKGLIERVITNMLHNAIRFSPTGSQVTVTVSRDTTCVRVEVRDSGPGIPPEYRDRIFDKFGQVEGRRENRKYSTGLGLAFCKLAVETHGGHIGVDSEAGIGSKFWFTLPVQPR